MKNYYNYNFASIIAFFAIIFSSFNASATHVSGGDITYRCLGNNQYEVTLTLFRDCSGATLGGSANVNFNSPCGNQNVTLNRISVTEVSQVDSICLSPTVRTTCNGGNIPGMQAQVYRRVVTLTPCDSWTMSYSLCCRNSTANVSGQPTYFVRTTLNNQVAPCNNSPRFVEEGIRYHCVGQPLFYDYGTIETDGDSLVYTLVSAESSLNNNVGYTGGATFTSPIPGLTLNSQTGQISFIANNQGFYIVVIEVSEYNSNGVLIGTTRRDMQFVIANCTNVVPDPSPAAGQISIINGNATVPNPNAPNIIEVCENEPFTFQAVFTDPNPGDNLSITTNVTSVLPGATLTTSGTNPLTATINWNPPSGYSGANTSFSLTVRDDACLIYGLQTFVYEINVLTTTYTQDDTTICEGASIPLNTFGGNIFNWFNIDGTPVTPSATFSCNPCQNPVITPSQTVTYYVVSDLANGCVNSDTVTITVLPDTTVFTPLTNVCLNAPPFTVTGGSPVGGTYSGPGVTNGVFNPSVAGVGIHTINYNFFNGFCTFSRGVQIEVYALPAPPVIDSVAPFCCGSTPINLTANVPGGVWSGVGIINTIDGTYNPACSVAGTHVIDYEITDNNGCKNVGNLTISVLPELIANAGPDQTTGFNTSVGISGNSTTGGTGTYTYSWAPANRATNPNISTTTTTVLNQTTVYTLTVVDGEGCTDTDQMIVSIVGGPLTVSLTANPTTVCGGQPVDLLAIPSGGQPPYVYTWLAPAGNTIGNTNSVTVNPTTQTTYTVRLSDANPNNTPVTATITINITGGPSVSLNPFPSTCINELPFQLSGGQPIGGVFSGTGVVGNNFDPAVAGIGSHIITYTFTDANLCVGEATQTIVVNDIPNPTLAAINDFCLNDNAVSLSGGSPTGGTYFGTGVDANGEFTPFNAGVGQHTIFYIFTDGNGCSNSASTIVNVHGNPVVTLDTTYTICIYDSPVTLTGGFPATGTYSGPGISANVFTTDTVGAGTYNVVYTYTDANGCVNSDQTQMIVNPSPIITFSTIPVICVNDPAFDINFATPNGGGYSGIGVRDEFQFVPDSAGVGTFVLTYDFINQFGCTSLDTVSVTVYGLPPITQNQLPLVCINDSAVLLNYYQPSNGVYSGPAVDSTFLIPSLVGVGVTQVVYTLTDTLGCVNVDTVDITVNDIPNVTFDPLANICITNPPLNLTGGNPTVGTYSGTGISNNVFNASVSGAGTFTVTYTYTDQIGCSNFATTPITVEPLPILNFPPFSNMCFNDNPLSLNSATPTGGTYTGTGVTNNIFTPNVAGNGTFTITYTYTLGACTNTATSPITVNPNPTIVISPLPVVCINDSLLVLDNASPQGGTFTGNGIDNNVLNPEEAGFGNLDVTYSFTDNNNCSSSEDFVIIIENILASFTADPTTGIEPLTVTFTNLSENNDINIWNFGNGGSSSDVNPIFTYNEFGEFTATLITISPNGCIDSASLFIKVDEYVYFIPNVFSPNGDGVNDSFKPKISGYEFVKGEIFNRWGKKMYDWEDPNQGWDGSTLSGGEASDGTYFYIITIADRFGNNFNKNGTINLFR
jgi:gliding motility-associated-like protein